MTEARHDALYTAIRAHRDHLIEVTGRVAQSIESLRGVARLLRSRAQHAAAKLIDHECDALASHAVALGAGLESLHRAADSTLDDTQPMDLGALLDAVEAEDD